MTKPLLAVVIGDPSGVGPEVCVRALATGRPTELAHVVLVGSRTTIDEAARISGVELPLRNVTSFADARAGDDVAVLDDGALRRDAYVIGKASAAGGAATYAWIQRTIAAAEAGDVDAIVVAPIDRSSWKLAGITGVTDEMHPPGTYLLRTTGNLRTIPIGEHVPFREIPAMVTEANVLHVIELIGEQMRRWGFASPRIAVAGLNPHASGPEDAEQIAPAVAAARARFRRDGPAFTRYRFPRGRPRALRRHRYDVSRSGTDRGEDVRTGRCVNRLRRLTVRARRHSARLRVRRRRYGPRPAWNGARRHVDCGATRGRYIARDRLNGHFVARTYIEVLFYEADAAEHAKRSLSGTSGVTVERAFVIRRDEQGYHVDGRFAGEPPGDWLAILRASVARLLTGTSREEDSLATSDAEAELGVGQSALVALIDEGDGRATDDVMHAAGGTMIRVAPATLDAEDRERFLNATALMGDDRRS